MISNDITEPFIRKSKYRCLILLAGLFLTLNAPITLGAQLPPTAVPNRLWKASLRNVTGPETDPDWEAFRFSREDSLRIIRKLKLRRRLPDTLFIAHIRAGDQNIDMMLSQSLGKSELFTFAIYLAPENGKIIDVDVLEYRESYGGEIDYPVFRKQFRGKSKPGQVVFRRTIRNISGATISSRSMTLAIHDLLTIYSEYRKRMKDNSGK